MTKSKNYWKNRERTNIAKQIKGNDLIADKIKSNQLSVMDDIQQQLDAFYGKYATSEGITMAEARKRAAKVDIKKYQSKAKTYVKTKNFTPIANEEMKLYNVTMRTNRLELLKSNVNLDLVAMTSEEEHFLTEKFTRGAREEYQRQSGILGETINHNEKGIKQIVNSSFNNAEWSTRLWDNQDALRSELNRLLNKSIVQGKGPKELAKEVRDKFESSVYNSERLMRTETARVQQDVFTDSAKQFEAEEYIFIAEAGACPICSAIDGEVFKFKDMSIGSNAYPMHPNCLCSSAIYVEQILVFQVADVKEQLKISRLWAFITSKCYSLVSREQVVHQRIWG